MFRKIKKEKRGISELLSYVLLVGLGVTLSVAVYSWLTFYIHQSKIELCPEGVSIIISNYNCSADKLSLEVRNKGLFNIDGFILRANNRTKGNPVFKIFVYNYTSAATPPLSPSQGFTHINIDYRATAKITELEIQPYRIFENSSIVLCDKAVIKQKVENCD